MIDKKINTVARSVTSLISPILIRSRGVEHYRQTQFLTDLLTGREPDKFYVCSASDEVSEEDVERTEELIEELFTQVDYDCEIVEDSTGASKIVEIQKDGYRYSFRNFSHEWVTIERDKPVPL